MRPYTCDIRTLKQLENKKKVEGMNQRVKSLQASTGIVTMIQQMSHQKRMNDLIQLYRRGIEDTVQEMSNFSFILLIHYLELSDRELFLIFNELNLNVDNDLHQLAVISDVILEKRSEVQLNLQNQNDQKRTNNNQLSITKDGDSYYASDQSKLYGTTKTKSLIKKSGGGPQIEDNVKYQFWEFRQSDEMVNYWVNNSTGRISYSCPFVDVIKKRINKNQKKSKEILSRIIPRDLNIEFLAPKKRVQFYMKVKQAGVSLIKNVLKKHSSMNGLQLFRSEQPKATEKNPQNGNAKTFNLKNFGKYVQSNIQKKNPIIEQTPLNNQNQVKNEQSQLTKINREFLQQNYHMQCKSPSYTGQLINQDNLQTAKNPFQNINLEDYIDLDGFKQENEIEFLPNQDLLNLMFSWPFTTITSFDTQIPLCPPTQIKIIHDDLGKIADIIPGVPIKSIKQQQGQKRSKSRQRRSNSRQSTRPGVAKIAEQFNRDEQQTSQDQSIGKSVRKPKGGMSELFQHLKNNLSIAIQQADERIANNKSMKVKKKANSFQKKGFINETKLLQKIFSKAFIDKVRRKISANKLNSAAVDVNILDDNNFQSRMFSHKPEMIVTQRQQKKQSVFQAAQIMGKQKLNDQIVSFYTEQSQQAQINLSKMSKLQETQVQKQLKIIKIKTTKVMNKSFSIYQQNLKQEKQNQGQQKYRASLPNEATPIGQEFQQKTSVTPTQLNKQQTSKKSEQDQLNGGYGEQRAVTPLIKNSPIINQKDDSSIPFTVAKSYIKKDDDYDDDDINQKADAREQYRQREEKEEDEDRYREEIEEEDEEEFLQARNYKSRQKFRSTVSKIQTPISQIRNIQSRQGFNVQSDINIQNDRQFSPFQRMREQAINMLNQNQQQQPNRYYYYQDQGINHSVSISSSESSNKLEQDNQFQKFAKNLFIKMAKTIGDPLGSKSQLNLLPPKPNISVPTIKFMAHKLGINKFEEPDLMWIAQQAVLISPLPRTLKMKRNFIELNMSNYDRNLTKIGYEYFKCLLNSQRQQRDNYFKQLNVSSLRLFLFINGSKF